MKTVDEYVTMAEEAQKDKAHVAVLTYYRNVIESSGYNSSAIPYLLAAVNYALGLKKALDRAAVVDWGLNALERIKPDASLEATIRQEIAKLQTTGDKNATT